MRSAFVLVLALLSAARAQAQCSMHGDMPPSNQTALLLQGMGNAHHAITASPEAQKWFDQGLNLTYGFNHDYAVLSFRKAEQVDPHCAMCAWGEALALGPNINLPLNPDNEKQALAAIQKAQSLEVKTRPEERAYIDALAKRYGEPGQDRAARDKAYADAMREIAKANPKDADAQTLFAESMMDLRPWDLWARDGKPYPGTDEIVSALSAALKIDPKHVGANHFWIHLWEGSPTPEKALPSAEKLPKLAPAAGHLVHMPAHVYLRVGRYADASKANEDAIVADQKYLGKTHAEGVYAAMYVAHNFQFLWFSSGMEGRSKTSIDAARTMAAHFPPEMVRAMAKDMPGVDAFLAPPYFALARFGHWDELLKEPAPPADFAYLTNWSYFARALAFAATGKLDDAAKEQAAFEAGVAKVPADVTFGPQNLMKDVLAIGQHFLAARIAEAQGKREVAIAELQQAAALEDALHYDEPPPWPIPVRVELGAALLRAGQKDKAEAVFREDLVKHPHSGWALFGLWKSLEGRDDKAAADAKKQFEKAWSKADVKLDVATL
ncbi:MAG: hypothetical protein JST54_13220 [Deltaproteobacteria bacterium]|nr:hypothetical protein [Deltaproteobacteria bacterium]